MEKTAQQVGGDGHCLGEWHAEKFSTRSWHLHKERKEVREWTITISPFGRPKAPKTQYTQYYTHHLPSQR